MAAVAMLGTPNDAIRRAVMHRNSGATTPVWDVMDASSPLWLAKGSWPRELWLLPMPRDEIQVSVRKLRDAFDAVGQATVVERCDRLLALNGRLADATVVAVHARQGVRADQSVCLAGEPTEKIALICRKVTGSDRPFQIAAGKLLTQQQPGELIRLSVPAWRTQSPGRPA